MSAPRLNSSFHIGDWKWKGITSVHISKSIYSYRDTATLILPAKVMLTSGDLSIAGKPTALQFKEGDKVKIDLGHDTDLRPEFRGFVSRVNFSQPCELELEGYSWLLRKRRNIKKSWARTTLREVLEEVVNGTEIVLHKAIPEIELRNIVINNATGTEVIDYIQGLFNGILKAFFIDEVLYMGLTYVDVTRETVKYRLGWNTLPADNLKYHDAEDVEVNVKIKFRNDAGKMITTETGTKGGIVHTETLSAVTDITTLEKVAKSRLESENYNGYEGSIETLIKPYAQPGYRAEVADPRYPVRSGVFFVESSTLDFGVSGTHRRVELGLRLGDL